MYTQTVVAYTGWLMEEIVPEKKAVFAVIQF